MTKYQNCHSMEDSPQNTVTRIKGILTALGIKLQEEWIRPGSMNTYSLRVTIENTSIGSKGKGITRECAMANAYSEFMKLFQNLWLVRWSNLWKDGYGFRYFPDEVYLTAEELVRSNSAFMKMYFKNRGMTDAQFSDKVGDFRKVHRMDSNLTEQENEYLSVPFFNLMQSKVEYLPYYAYSAYYHNNGMCTGNTPEEALIQGLSEIIERVVQKKIAFEKPVLPDIPEEYLKKYTYVYERYQQLKSTPGYTIMLKDCSFGGAYPVSGLVIIEQSTGYYGLKLACHPDLGIAIEKTLTEAAQGSDILHYAKKDKAELANKRIPDVNILNDVSKYNNRHTLNRFVEWFGEAGYEILIRDVSYLGYPSYQILVPGLSEAFEMTDRWYNTVNSKFYIMKLLNNPNKINKTNVKYILGVMEGYAASQLENSIRSHYGMLNNISYPAEDYGLGWTYFTAMCYALREDYKKASERMLMIVSQAGKDNLFYYGVYQYFCGMAYGNNHHKVIADLRHFFDGNICDRIDAIFRHPDQILVNQYPEHDFMDYETCRLTRCCEYYAYRDIAARYKEAQKQHPIRQEDIIRVFACNTVVFKLRA